LDQKRRNALRYAPLRIFTDLQTKCQTLAARPVTPLYGCASARCALRAHGTQPRAQATVCPQLARPGRPRNVSCPGDYWRPSGRTQAIEILAFFQLRLGCHHASVAHDARISVHRFAPQCGPGPKSIPIEAMAARLRTSALGTCIRAPQQPP